MTVFAGEPHLRYRSLAPRPAPAALRLDTTYRLCQLPLVDPAHADVIARQDGSDYAMGRYAAARLALVIPIDAAQLEASPAYRRLLAEMRHAPFAAKIAWDVHHRRRACLHATLRSHLHRDHTPAALRAVAARLRRTAPFRARLMGPWYGERNHGRLYLPLVPELRRGLDAARRLQRLAGGPETALYTVGLINLRDHLTAAETAALRALIAAWRRRVLLEFTVDRIDLHATHDDLALDSRVVERIPLTGRRV